MTLPPITQYAFSTKTVFDPARGLSIKNFNSVREYLVNAPLKVLTIAALVNSEIIYRHGIGDVGAKELAAVMADCTNPNTEAITHTDFHEDAVRIRASAVMPGRIVRLDELARRHNPHLRSVALAKLVALHVPNAQRTPIDLIEGHHDIDALASANLVDCLLMLQIHRALARSAAGRN